MGEGLNRLPIDQSRVHDVTGEEHQIGLLPFDQFGQVAKDKPLLAPALCGLLRRQAGEGTVQMEVGGMDDF